MRTTPLLQSITLGISASLAFAVHGALADDIAYAQVSGPGFDFVRIDFSTGTVESIGPLSIYLMAGTFVGDDFSKEYVIDYPGHDLYSIDTSSAEATLIGSVSTAAIRPAGMHWDPADQKTYLVATDASCTTSTLYSLDVSDGSTMEVGSSPGCIASLAIDAEGHAFGIDLVAGTLVSIDTTTGVASTVGPLGFTPDFAIGGFDFDLSNGELYLFAYDVNTLSNDVFVVDTASGSATLIAPEMTAYAGLAFARDVDSIFANGFDAGVVALR